MKNFIIRNNSKITKVLIIIFWMMVWEIASLGINREVYLPSPIHTIKALMELIGEINFWNSVLMSVFRVALGFFISCGFGILIGIICGLNNFLYALFNPLVIAIKSTPVMSFIIIALIWFQSGNVPVFVCVLMCFPIIWTNVVHGIRQVDRNLLQMAHLYNVKKFLVIKDIYIPSVAPYIAAGITTALGLGWKVTVAAEVMSSPKFSIGRNLYDAKVYLESDRLFAWTGVVIILSFGFEYFFKHLLRKFKKGNLPKDV
jgi:NitT/TauT family transport system permease protein